MLDIISSGFRQAKDSLRGRTTITDDNIREAIKLIRTSLLEADVEYSVTKDFLRRVEERALGQTVQLRAGAGESRVKVTTADHFVAICQQELEALMGPADSSLHMAHNRPTTVMMVGLQGSGKTTTTAKLCKYLMERQKRKPLLVAADIYRPAAVDQLRKLGDRLGVPVFHEAGANPVDICRKAAAQAYQLGCDVVLLDTAGRLTIDETLMQELANIKLATNPDNILFVCDAMMGQDAVTTARAFNDRLDLSGVIMTKLDGDARGGAALSIRQITGKPIKFLGMGEGLDNLEEFRPEGLASRILGQGDVIGLMQDFQRVAGEDQEKEALKMLQGQFTFRDFYEQISMIQRMGPLKDIMAKLPMQDMLPKGMDLDDRELTKVKAMIDSMTEQERTNPSVFNPSRVRRIARGSGRPEKDVNELIVKFRSMRKVMGMMGKNMGLLGKIPGMGQLSQLNQLRKMAQGMGGGSGMPGLGGLGDLLGGMGNRAGAVAKKPVDRDKQRKLRKQAKQARKKNRKR